MSRHHTTVPNKSPGAESSSRPPRGGIPTAAEHFERLPDTAFVRQPTVQLLFGFSASTVWRRVKSGDLPAPKKLGPRVSAWNVGELRAALKALGGQAA